jgi:FkbM family methyltransferase
MKCTVIIPFGPGHQELVLRAETSVKEAIAEGKGAFDEIKILCVDDSSGKLGRSKARNIAVAESASAGTDWIFFLDADDLMAAHAFRVVQEHLHNHDALWGEIYEADIPTQTANLRPNQITPITSLDQILTNDPYLTIQMGHFVNIKTATEFRFNESMNCGEDVDYYLRIWKEKRCLKIDKPLFFNVRGQHSTGPKSATGKDWREAIGHIYTKFCAENSVVSNLSFEDKTVNFKLTNTLDLIQNQIAKGRFFEPQELIETLSILPKFARILDIGSNIGNHALFFTICGEASEIHCFEPSQNTANTLHSNFQINKIPASRYKIHRMAVGAKSQQGTLCNLDNLNSGATSIKINTEGPIHIDSLDNIFTTDSVFDLLKIDVEGMELEVLEGAGETIKRSQPIILIEVSNSNKSKFFSWLAHNNYKVHRAFELVHASNYLLTPNKPRTDFLEGSPAFINKKNHSVPLAPNQPSLGWSLHEFISNYSHDNIIELSIDENKKYIATELKNDKRVFIQSHNIENLPKGTILLSDILENIDDNQLSMIFKKLVDSNRDILLFSIMDSRWNNNLNQNGHFRDIENYIIEGQKHGYILKEYVKLPHKSAFEKSYQLESRATLLNMKKAEANNSSDHQAHSSILRPN